MNRPCNASPTMPRPISISGVLLYRMDVIQEAINHLEAAVSLKPDYVNAHFLLAKCYHIAHQDAKALAAGRTALELGPIEETRAHGGGYREVVGERGRRGRQITPTVWVVRNIRFVR